MLFLIIAISIILVLIDQQQIKKDTKKEKDKSDGRIKDLSDNLEKLKKAQEKNNYTIDKQTKIM